MILGIKTTGGVSKLKTKTTDGVTKAVECACCNICDPDALWGPGYDTSLDTIQVLNQTLTRIGSCSWQLVDCYCYDADFDNLIRYEAPECAPICISTYGMDGHWGVYNYYISLTAGSLAGTLDWSYAPTGPLSDSIAASYEYTSAIQDSNGKTHKFPYGIYTKVFDYEPELGGSVETITISPP